MPNSTNFGYGLHFWQDITIGKIYCTLNGIVEKNFIAITEMISGISTRQILQSITDFKHNRVITTRVVYGIMPQGIPNLNPRSGVTFLKVAHHFCVIYKGLVKCLYIQIMRT